MTWTRCAWGLAALWATTGCGDSFAGADGGGGDGGEGLTKQPYHYDAPHDFTRAPEPGCTAVLAAPCSDCPVLIDAEISHDQGARGITVAAGARALAAFRVQEPTDPHLCLFELDQGDAIVSVDPISNAVDPSWIHPAHLASDASGEAHFLLDRAPAVAHYARAGTSWSSTAVSSDALAEHVVRGVVTEGDTRHAVYYGHPPEPGFGNAYQLFLATGTGTGWSRELVFDAAEMYDQGTAAVAVRDGDVAVPYWAWPGPASPAAELRVWSNGAAEVVFSETGAWGELHAAFAGKQQQPIVAWTNADGIHVVAPQAGWERATIAGSALPELSGCPTSDSECPAADGTTCTETGDGAMFGAPAGTGLVRTDDGSVWAAYTQIHVERDYAIHNECADIDGCWCAREPVADRSTAELVLARIDPGSGDAHPRFIAELGRVTDQIELSLSSRGASIHVALGHTLSQPTVFRYLVVDASQL